MISIFRQSNIGQIVFILLAIVALWTRAFISPALPQPASAYSPLYEVIYSLTANKPILASVIALLLVICEGIWFNIILNNHKVVYTNTLLPTLLYIVAMSWDAEQLTLTPILFVNLLMLPACFYLLSDGSTTLGFERNFNASFCIGLAALFYLPAMCYILPLAFVFVVYKLYRWRNVIVSITGLIAPFIILFTYAFLTDKLEYTLFLIKYDIMQIHLDWEFSLPSSLTGIIFLLAVIAALFSQLGTLNEKTAQQRIDIGILSLPLLASLPMLAYNRLFPANTQLMALPFAFLFTMLLLADRRRKWIGEIMFWIMIVTVLTNVWIG